MLKKKKQSVLALEVFVKNRNDQAKYLPALLDNLCFLMLLKIMIIKNNSQIVTVFLIFH